MAVMKMIGSRFPFAEQSAAKFEPRDPAKANIENQTSGFLRRLVIKKRLSGLEGHDFETTGLQKTVNRAQHQWIVVNHRHGLLTLRSLTTFRLNERRCT